MNNFCEECGHQLSPEDKFCEECGHPVLFNDDDAFDSDKHIQPLSFGFFKSKRSNLPEEFKQHQFGILFTDFKKITAKFGEKNTDVLIAELDAFIEHQKKFGYFYLVLDASDNRIDKLKNSSWEHYVLLLNKGIKRLSSKLSKNACFVLLFGGDEIVPVPVFANPVQNSDKDVPTDLPYSTLSVNQPIENADARSPKIVVGRIPTGTDTVMEQLVNVLHNTMQSMGNLGGNKSFALSANCWQELSAYVNQRIGNTDLYVSPGLTIENLDKYYPTNSYIHYFNLHGSSHDAYWYGQAGNDLPKAFSPEAIAKNKVFNIIGVEACYGAYFIGKKKKESILLSSLFTKTVSFLGSSKIAYGPTSPPMSLADIVIHDYLEQMQEGQPAGLAHLVARENAFNTGVEKDPYTSLLTLMEFNLYGDPVFSMGICDKSRPSGKSARLYQGIDGNVLEEIEEKHLVAAMRKTSSPDSVYGMIRNAVDSSQKRISELISQQVWAKYPDFKGITPAFQSYEFNGKNFNQLSYKKEMECFDEYLIVSTTAQGELISEYMSK